MVDGVAAWTEVLVGTSALLLGAGLITSGVVGLGMESSPPPAPLGPLVQMPAPVEPTTASVALAPPGSATAVLTSRSAELATQLWIEVRAGHCARATLAARRLAVLDRDKVIALIDRNPEVASCVAYKM